MASILLKNNAAIQNLLHAADEVTHTAFGPNSTVTLVGEDQYSILNSFNVNRANVNNSSDLHGLRIEEVDEITANQIAQSLSTTTNAYQQQYQLIDANNAANLTYNTPASAFISNSNYSGELYQDPNPAQIVRRSSAHPVTYRQNIAVRFLQPPPVPPPGPLIIKEVRPPQPPAPAPLRIRQQAPPYPIPRPLVLRERPPRGPAPIPSQTIIRKLPPIPVPPRSVVVERYPPIPPRPRDIVIERWLPYSKEPQPRKVITHRAPPPQPYPPPRNTIILYEPVQANVVRSIQNLGVEPRNPQEYLYRYGNSLLDTSTLLAQAQQVGVAGNLNPPINSYAQQYQHDLSEYVLNNTQTVLEPEYDYNTTSWENQVASNNNNNNNQVQVYWTDPHKDVRMILQRLGFAFE